MSLSKQDNDSHLPAYVQMRQQILSRISRANGDGNRKFLSVRKLAAAYNVSAPTAAKVVKQLIADGVLISRRGLGTFIVPAPASSAGCIGLIVGGGAHIHFSRVFMKIMSGIYEVLAETDLVLQFINAGNRDQALLNEIRTARLDGVIWISPSQASMSSLKTLERANVKVVGIDLRQRGVTACSVASDWYGEAYGMAAYLLSNGHKKIVLAAQAIQAHEGDGLYASVNKGFADACRAHGVRPMIPPMIVRDDFAARLETLLDLKKDLTALAIDSKFFQPALKILADRKRRVPQDIAIITEDDHLTMCLKNPVPTRVARPLRRLGETAARKMLAWLDGKTPPQSEVLEWEIIKGET